MNNHTHPYPEELHVMVVPADSHEPVEMKAIPHKLDHMQKLVDGYIEITRWPGIPELPCGCRMVMVVDEEGVLKDKPRNTRAMNYYPGLIVGDVFLVGEGIVRGMDGLEDIDFFSLPPFFHDWAGPGEPFPTPRQPWESIDPESDV